MRKHLEDHGLPLVQLKEERREVVLALKGSKRLSTALIGQIAAIQQTIAAMEAVIVDLDAETEMIVHERTRRSLKVI